VFKLFLLILNLALSLALKSDNSINELPSGKCKVASLSIRYKPQGCMVILNWRLIETITGFAYRRPYLACGINFILDITMPVRNSSPESESLKHYKSLSYETLAASWLLNDGWDVFLPMIGDTLRHHFDNTGSDLMQKDISGFINTLKILLKHFNQFNCSKIPFSVIVF
jgi:hypothetical protein